MDHKIRPLPFKPPRLIGLSEQFLAKHYENGYGGALQRMNAIEARLTALDLGNTPADEIRRLQRDALQAANAVGLFEAFFDCLGGEDGLGGPAVPPDGPLAEAIARDFGGFERWREAFSALGRALSSGSGWVLLIWSPRHGRLINYLIENEIEGLAGSVPLVALDMNEQAYRPDFDSDAAAYLEALLRNLHWDRPAARFAKALGKAGPAEIDERLPPETLRDRMAVGDVPLLLDVCLADDRPKRHDKLPGAIFLGAEEMADWIETLPRDRPIVAYCMYGFQVSGNAVAALRERGHDARMLAGGIASWRAIGGPTEPLD